MAKRIVMQDVYQEVVQVFGNKVRVRVCGILIENNTILLVNHRGLNETNLFWSPPGGGILFGESAAQSLQREFREETGLDVHIVDFLCVNEFMSHSLQAVELFFLVSRTGGCISTGSDPELQQQIIKHVKFMSMAEIQQYHPTEIHDLLAQCTNLEDIQHLQGRFFTKHL